MNDVKEKFSTFVLGEVDGKHVGEVDGEGTDILARDEVEREAKKVEVPGVSREPLNPDVVSLKVLLFIPYTLYQGSFMLMHV